MGTQPETEEPVEQPVAPREQDVEVDAELDLALRVAPAAPFDDVDATPLAMCQICMEFFGSKEVVRGVCGESCLAEVCPGCLVQHLTASVYSYYPGVLPKVKCPACLVSLNKIQWKKYVVPEPAEPERPVDAPPEEEEEIEYNVAPPPEEEPEQNEEGEDEHIDDDSTDGEGAEQYDDEDDGAWAMDHSHVLEKYEVLCRQSCGFQSPCCHNPEYSMLARVHEDDIEERVIVKLPSSQAEQLPKLSQLFKDYCFHRIEVPEIYDFIIDAFGANSEEVLEIVLSNIVDDERRANLLLLHLFHNPDTYTTCCDYTVCFKSKTVVHHDGNCGDFEVDESVLDCPGCRVTLVKVDGCDSVTCLCGYQIEWPREMEKQRLQRKHLAPGDNKEYAVWRVWSHNLDACLNQIDELEVTLRQIRLKRMIRENRVVLLKLLQCAVRRTRLNILIRDYRDRLRPLVRAHVERRKASAERFVEVRGSLTPYKTTSQRIAPAA